MATKHASALPPRICARDSGAIERRTKVPRVRSLTRLSPNDMAQPMRPQSTPCGNVISNGLPGPLRARVMGALTTFSGCHRDPPPAAASR